jgi:aminoglycoside phosphotransferase (APT) family kinase protein
VGHLPRDGRAGIDAGLVRRLVAAQHPHWRELEVVPVEVDGWDNRTYRLGPELSVRLPTDDSYVPAVAKEHRWLPVLAPQLPLPVPEPVALGHPSPEFPRPWSVRRWIDGMPVTDDLDQDRFARDLAAFLRALWTVDATDGPVAGEHSFHRGASLRAYDAETRACLARLGVDDSGVWETALESAWDRPGV